MSLKSNRKKIEEWDGYSFFYTVVSTNKVLLSENTSTVV